MVFSSTVFLFLFLPLVLAGYYLLPWKVRMPFLFLMNLLFYGWGEPFYVLLMLFSITVNYTGGRLIHKFKERKKLILTVFIAVNLSLLFYFKYAGLFLNLSGIALPIGISFYTFQSMSYIIDVYRGEVEVQNDFIAFGTYVSLFPQLIAGPIVKYRDVVKELTDNKTPDTERIYSGCLRFIIGLSKKLLLANAMGNLWSTLSKTPETNGIIGSWVGITAFAFQIYFDFSGYSDMAIGLGRLIGFEFLENFNYPYISRSVTEFWRRWHISLSTWFKEYVYIPLGGNRRGALRQLFNIVAVWMLTGLWHGASWNFVFWGLYFAVFLIIEKLFLLKALKKIPAFFSHFYLIFVVFFGWTIFYFTDTDELLSYVRALLSPSGGAFSSDSLRLTLGYLPMFIICAVCSTPKIKKLREKLSCSRLGTSIETAAVFLLFILCIAALVSETYNPFIYFRF